MCGICGKLEFQREHPVERRLLSKMLDTIRHRGPDGDGIYVSKNVGLGHRRLAIIDLNTGQQPLSNEDGTIWIVFNGEIYNYQELRSELLAHGHTFRTMSDTEVIVHLYEELGAECVKKLRGMFAFAIWDQNTQTLTLARDRVGIKPLYYRLTEKSLLFGSEIKAILADEEAQVEVLPAMIDGFLSFDYCPGPETIFKGISKLSPGTYLTVQNGKATTNQYWDLSFARSSMSLSQAEDQLEELLEEAVKLHMISDVPVGFLVSGGIDSTAMLSYAKGKTDKALSSYTLGFASEGVADERPYARVAAEIYQTDHHEMTISASNFRDFMPDYVWHMEEPTCEPPAVALYYVSRLASKYVKVLISGEGGDEAFGGYPNYRNLLWLERMKSAAGPFKGLLFQALTQVNRYANSNTVAKYLPLMRPPMDSYYYSRTSGPFRYFVKEGLKFYSEDFGHSIDGNFATNILSQYIGEGTRNTSNGDLVNKMLYMDTKTWLVDDLLLKADKMTMANSVELRVPLLDHKLLEFAASLPGNYKVRGATTKYIAKNTLKNRVPKVIMNRKKTGFPVPYESWIRKDLKDWAWGVLLDSETVNRGYFRKGAVETLLKRDLESGGYSKEIFSLLTLELWHRAFVGSKSRSVALANSKPA
jgi:asparagine synthase (glutamine-hydrolysing)